MAAASALDGSDGVRHGHSVLLGSSFSPLIQALRVYFVIVFSVMVIEEFKGSICCSAYEGIIFTGAGPVRNTVSIDTTPEFDGDIMVGT